MPVSNVRTRNRVPLPPDVVVEMLREDNRALSHAAADIIVSQIGAPGDLLTAAREALNNLEYVERTFPNQTGYGVRQQTIARLRAAINEIETVKL